MVLCEWSVTSNRSGELRFGVANGAIRVWILVLRHSLVMQRFRNLLLHGPSLAPAAQGPCRKAPWSELQRQLRTLRRLHHRRGERRENTLLLVHWGSRRSSFQAPGSMAQWRRVSIFSPLTNWSSLFYFFCYCICRC